jgi:MinD-like ATPase involved in chromosome partitioning or flagellar assembly
MLITVGSVKSSGVTTTALALAAMWPGDIRVLVVEADPAGGDLAAWFGLHPEPGLVSLSADARRNHTVDTLFAHAQALPGGLPVVAAPASAEQAAGALDLLTGDGAPLWKAVAASDEVVVVVDAGRLDPNSPAHAVMAASDVSLLVTRPTLADSHRLAGRLDILTRRMTAAGTQLGLVLLGPGYDRDQVEASLQVPVLAHLPHDTKAASHLSGAGGTRRIGALALPKAAHVLGRDLTALLTRPSPETAADPAERDLPKVREVDPAC